MPCQHDLSSRTLYNAVPPQPRRIRRHAQEEEEVAGLLCRPTDSQCGGRGHLATHCTHSGPVLPKEVYRLKQLEADSKTFKRSSDMFNFMITDQQKMIASYYMALAELEVYMQGFENGWSDEINKEINKIVNGAPFWRHPAIRERDWERLDPSEQHVAREDVHNLGYVFKKSAELSTLARELRRKAERDALLADPWWDEVKDEMRKSVSMFKEDSIMTLTHHEIKAASLKAALEKGQKAQVALDIAIPKQKRLVEELASNEDENGACKVQ